MSAQVNHPAESEKFLTPDYSITKKSGADDEKILKENSSMKKRHLNGKGDHTKNGKAVTRRENSVIDKPWIDKGWAWMVVIGSLSVMFVCMGQIRNMGLLLAEVKIQFSESTAIAAILPSVVYMIMPMMSPISSVLTTHFGSRPVVFTGVVITVFAHVSVMFAENIVHILLFYALPLAIGTGLCYTSTCVIIGQYFQKKTSLAYGAATSGAPIAGICLPSFYTFLSDRYGFKGAILILGGTAAHAAIGAILMRPTEFWEKLETEKPNDCVDMKDSETGEAPLQRMNSVTSAESRTISILGETITASQLELNELKEDEKVEDEKAKTQRSKLKSCFSKINQTFRFTLLKEVPFLIHLVVSCCGFVGYVLSYALIPSHALDIGIDRSLAYFLISVGGMGDLPSRYILAYLSDKWSRRTYGKKYHIMSICMIVSGINSILIADSTSYVRLCIHMVFIGFCGGGGFIGANVAVLRDTIGLTKTANGGLGIVMFISGILIGVLPPVMGYMRDVNGSFEIPFIIIGVVMMFGGFFTWLQLLAERWSNSKKEDLRMPDEIDIS